MALSWPPCKLFVDAVGSLESPSGAHGPSSPARVDQAWREPRTCSGRASGTACCPQEASTPHAPAPGPPAAAQEQDPWLRAYIGPGGVGLVYTASTRGQLDVCGPAAALVVQQGPSGFAPVALVGLPCGLEGEPELLALALQAAQAWAAPSCPGWGVLELGAGQRFRTVEELLVALEAVWAAQPDCSEPTSCPPCPVAVSPAGAAAAPPGAACKRQREVARADSWASSAGGQHTPAGWAAAAAAPTCSVCSSPGGGRSDEASSPAKRLRTQSRLLPQGHGPVPRPTPAALAAAEAAADDNLPFFSEEELQLLEECLLPGAALRRPSDAASAVGPVGSAEEEGEDADSSARTHRAAAGAHCSVFAVAAHHVAGPSAAVATFTVPAPFPRYAVL